MPKCIECGFFGIIDHHTNQPIEAGKRARKCGFYKSGSGRELAKGESFCHVMWKNFPTTTDYVPDNLEELSKNRECEKFIPHHIGRTPQQHEDILTNEFLADFQKQMIKALSGVENAQSEIAKLKKRQLKMETSSGEKLDRHNLTTRIISIVGVAISAIAAFISMWIAINSN